VVVDQTLKFLRRGCATQLLGPHFGELTDLGTRHDDGAIVHGFTGVQHRISRKNDDPNDHEVKQRLLE
jgi:hypothetical protein